jgi:hypothetical protein
MKLHTLCTMLALVALALLAAGCREDEIPDDEQYPGNDPDQPTDMTVEPMHNYADDAEDQLVEEDEDEEQGVADRDQLSEEVEEDIQDTEGMTR